ncbi:hypothetical protein EVAR_64880_1 [Eumeta japonica]|uniref:Uncharacterized protein n=1 Tax=Eumeta variegata TaxID=151549 RepID=A0A4C2A844_EUMVA|nr:hypothetical protein EVAR_64880_1 [Eumeta japonica]
MPPKPNQMETRRQPLTRIIDENEDGYEIPINGIISECNCMIKQNDEESDKCQKSVHITYEHLPNEEPPPRIYEEIMHLDKAIQTNADKVYEIMIIFHLKSK